MGQKKMEHPRTQDLEMYDMGNDGEVAKGAYFEPI